MDEGKLLAMFENGSLKTAKPGQGTTVAPLPPPEPISDGEYSVPSPIAGPSSPGLPWESSPDLQQDSFPKPGFQNYSQLAGRQSSLSARNSYATMNQQPSTDQQRRLSDKQGQGHYGVTPIELPGEYYHPQQTGQGNQQQQQQQPLAFRYELPGDTSLYPPDQKARPPPNATHPAYQNRSSPLSSPRLSSTGTSSTNPSARSSYQAYNPEQPQQQQQSSQQQQTNTGAPRVTSHQSIPEEPAAGVPLSPSSGQFPQVRRTTSGDESYYHNYSRLRPPQPPQPPAPEPDHQRLSNLSISNPSMGRSTSNSSSFYGEVTSTTSSQQQQQSGQQSVVATCPVCKTFQGDEPAVGHHVEVTHGLS